MVLYKVRTSAPGRYSVKPRVGVLHPREEARIKIGFVAKDAGSANGDKFSIEARFVDPSHDDVQDPEKCWPSTRNGTTVDDARSRMPLTRVNLTCETPSTLPPGLVASEVDAARGQSSARQATQLAVAHPAAPMVTPRAEFLDASPQQLAATGVTARATSAAAGEAAAAVSKAKATTADIAATVTSASSKAAAGATTAGAAQPQAAAAATAATRLATQAAAAAGPLAAVASPKVSAPPTASPQPMMSQSSTATSPQTTRSLPPTQPPIHQRGVPLAVVLILVVAAFCAGVFYDDIVGRAGLTTLRVHPPPPPPPPRPPPPPVGFFAFLLRLMFGDRL